MFSKIMVPVDLAHLGKLDKALGVAAAEAKAHDAEVIYVSVTAPTPGPLAHNPLEFTGKLDAFAAEQAGKHGISAAGHVIVSHDPAIDMDQMLLETARQIEADLIIMASHRPGLAEYFWPSNGGQIAGHADISVFIVRDGG